MVSPMTPHQTRTRKPAPARPPSPPDPPARQAGPTGPSARRLLPAAALSLLTFATLGVAVGVAAPPAQGLPDALALPPMRLGDAWAYDAVLEGDWRIQADDKVRLGQPVPAATFAWDGAEALRGGDGLLHRAHRLEWSGLSYLPFVHGQEDKPHASFGERRATVWMADPSDLARPPVASEAETSSVLAHSSVALELPVLGTPLYSVAAQADGVQRSRLYGAVEPCLVRNALQGRTVLLDSPLPLFPDCRLAGLLKLDGLQFVATGTEEVQGLPTVRFVSLQEPAVEAWMSPALPYPVQVRFSARSDAIGDSGPGGHATLRLTGAKLGDQALQADTLADRDPAPALEPAPREAWGPDDTGSTLPFPLSEAYRIARESPTYPDLRDYLAAHPDAYVGHAHFSTVHDDAGTEQAWDVAVTDGTSGVAFEVARWTQPTGLPPPLPQSNEGVEVRSRPFFDWFPAAAAVPRTMPTLASLEALWLAYVPEAKGGPTGWSMQVLDGDDGMATVSVQFGAAMEFVRATVLPGTTAAGYAMSGVPVGTSILVEDGAIRARLELDSEATKERKVAGLSAPSEAGEPVQPAESDTLTLAGLPLAFPDSPAAATGVGAFALLAGLLYWLWPAVKAGGVVGLFTRLRTPDLLRNPARAQVLQAIEANPGIHYQALVRLLGMGRGALEHHLEKLVHGGLVRRHAANGYTCHFAAGAATQVEMDRSAALKSPGARAVLGAIRERPGRSAQEVAAATGLSPATVNHHLKRLVGAGAVQATRDGRSLRLVEAAGAGAAA